MSSNTLLFPKKRVAFKVTDVMIESLREGKTISNKFHVINRLNKY